MDVSAEVWRYWREDPELNHLRSPRTSFPLTSLVSRLGPALLDSLGPMERKEEQVLMLAPHLFGSPGKESDLVASVTFKMAEGFGNGSAFPRCHVVKQ